MLSVLPHSNAYSLVFLFVQETHTVYFTTKADFPRCRIDICSSVESGYLRISRHFLEDVRKVWLDLQDKEKKLGVELDGRADPVPAQELKRRIKLAHRDLGNSEDPVNQDAEQDMQETRERDHAREKQRVEIHALQRSIVAPMRDLIKRYGAVWVDQVRCLHLCKS